MYELLATPENTERVLLIIRLASLGTKIALAKKNILIAMGIDGTFGVLYDNFVAAEISIKNLYVLANSMDEEAFTVLQKLLPQAEEKYKQMLVGEKDE